MKIGDTYIHTVTNTRLRVEEVMETPTGPTGYYPFPVNYVEKQIKMEDGTFKRG